jgi:ketol-acid reductoisomerase
MAGGFNHNFHYQGEMYHVQTEDSGTKTARIVTLLFRGGTILASEKYSYADLLGREDLPQLIEERMKEQHKEMVLRLKGGEFDSAMGQQDAENDPCADGEASRMSDEDLETLVFAYLTVEDGRYRL